MDKACQTTLEGNDTQDALRINPFLVQREAAKKNEEDVDAKAIAKKDLWIYKTPEIKADKRIITEAIEEECYPIDNEKRGLCLVFEHDTFAPYLGLRYVT